MLIPIDLSPSSTVNPKLPSCLAKISHDEVVLIELQGSLEVESNHPSERDGKHVGKLKIDETTNKPTLTIGHHLLEGKIQALPKPLAVIVRSSKPRQPTASGSKSNRIASRNDPDRNPDNDPDEDVVDGEEEDDDIPDLFTDSATADDPNQEQPSSSGCGLEETGSSWSIVAVVKKKIVFPKRPMPITNKTITK